MKMTVEEALKHIGTYAIMVGERMPLQVAQALDVLKNKARECEQYDTLKAEGRLMVKAYTIEDMCSKPSDCPLDCDCCSFNEVWATDRIVSIDEYITHKDNYFATLQEAEDFAEQQNAELGDKEDD